VLLQAAEPPAMLLWLLLLVLPLLPPLMPLLPPWLGLNRGRASL